MNLKGSYRALALELLILIGVLVFSRGFLPPTRTKLGFSNETPKVSPKFERVILMVVDAMRSDFLFSSQMSPMDNVHELLRNGNGYAFTAFSDPPTVTLPRIKGLTTGASPNFLDAVINIAESDSASTLENQDSWIQQMKVQKKQLHMFGDDTWLKLFPDVFDKFEGTSSFYVADFTEVDNNVTRHLQEELGPKKMINGEAAGWDALILHYLGLDHIGHKGGPNSIHMPEKLREMDNIVKQVFDSLDDSTLFVLAGDHGMNDVGNHGGASEGETSAALALFAKRFSNKIDSPLPDKSGYSYHSQIYQVDIVPTLAMLLGFPIPKNSLGVLIQDLLPLWPSEADQNEILNANCRHLDMSTSSEANNGCTWDNLRKQQIHLMRTSSEHIIHYMVLGVISLVITALICFIQSLKTVRRTLNYKVTMKDSALLSWWIIIPVLYFIGMMGSSTVEEEHYIWYWGISGMLATLLVLLPANQDKLNVLVILICFRVIRGWNTAGQKWTSLTDSVDLIKAHPYFLWSLVICSFAYVALIKPDKKGNYKQCITIVASLVTLCFKFYSTKYPLSLPWMIKLAWVSFGTSMLDLVLGSGKATGALLLFIIQTRLENIPIWVTLAVARQSLIKLVRRHGEKYESGISKSALSLFASLLVLCFEYASFFAIGGSNSLATIDLSNAYNGVSGYNIPLVALLTYLGNWSTSLYWTMSLSSFPNARILRAWFYSVACVGVALACLILREHLFIWTVFSPKLLYVAAWLVFHEFIATTLVTITC